MANKDMFLYWGSGSAPCWKAMLVLAEKGLWQGLPNKLLSFSNKEHKSEEVLKLNPRGQVPTFKDGALVVNESNAVCMYLEEKYTKDQNRLIPTDTSEKAKVFQKMFETANIQSQIIEPLLYYKFRTKKEEWDKNYIQERAKAASEELKRWNDYLEGKDYLACGRFTMADVFLFPYVAFFVRLGVKYQKFSNLQRYYDNICKRQSVQDTWPPHWKDSPSPNMLEELEC